MHSTTPRQLLLISSGTGPSEVRVFVAALAEALADRLAGQGVRVLDRIEDGDPPRSAALTLQGEGRGGLGELLGTHVLLARSETRGRNARKRWYAGVSLHPLVPGGLSVVDPQDVVYTAARASGPGGQHVNVTESAVRAQHRPSGLVVRVSSERSQHSNRRLALERLGELLAQQAERARSTGETQRWLSHHTLERGNAVMQWRWDQPSGRLVPDVAAG